MNGQDTPRNFAAHALGSLRRFSRGNMHNTKDQVFAFRVREAAYWLENSIKFIAPPNGAFLERVDTLAEGAGFPHLPYDSIVVEYAYDGLIPTKDGPAQQPDMVCVLAFYPNGDAPTCRLVRNTYGATDNGEFVVWPICGFSAIPGAWAPLTPVLVTPTPRIGCGVVWKTIGQEKRIGLQVMVTEWETEQRKLSRTSRGFAEGSDEEILHEAARDVANEALAVIELCNVIACTNVQVRDIPAPSYLNAKRIRKGKVPLFSYKVLELKESAKSSDSHGGSHSSPRLHLRRGHIRRLATGGKTWVRPHMVGDKKIGLVVKDYSARALGSADHRGEKQ